MPIDEKIGVPYFPPPPPPPKRNQLIGGRGSGPSASASSPGVPQGYAGGIPGPMAAVPLPLPTTAASGLPEWMLMARRIDDYLRRKKSPLTGLGSVFVKQAQMNNLDPLLLPAISGAESSFGTNNAAQTKNPFGWGPHMPFDSWKQGIKTVAKGLSKGYVQQGLDTIPEIQQKWAPLGAGNDPTNLNQNWISAVSQFYNELERAAPTPRPRVVGVLGQTKWNDLGGPAAHSASGHHIWQNDNAIDLGAPVGTPVYAPFGGRLTGGFGPSNDGSGTIFGNRLSLFSPRLNNTMFFTHMNRYGPGIEAGARVRRGDVLGYVGPMPGGPSHLHFASQYGNPYNYVSGGRVLPIAGATPGPYDQGGTGGGVYGNPYQNEQATQEGEQWQAAMASRGSALFNSALNEETGMGRPRKKRKKYVDDLVNNLLQGGA